MTDTSKLLFMYGGKPVANPASGCQVVYAVRAVHLSGRLKKY